MNITIVAGQLSRPPERRVLPSGDELVELDVRVARPGERAESVPVVWPSPPPLAVGLAAGEAVVVVGRVRRRFFRVGGSTQSRTEVVADGVVPARRAAAVRKLVAGASAALDGGVTAATSAAAVRRRTLPQAADAV